MWEFFHALILTAAIMWIVYCVVVLILWARDQWWGD